MYLLQKDEPCVQTVPTPSENMVLILLARLRWETTILSLWCMWRRSIWTHML